MSYWIQNCFLFLLFAVNAIPVLACQQQEYQRFPRTLDQAIDPYAAVQNRSSLSNREISKDRWGSQTTPSPNHSFHPQRAGSAASSNRSTPRRPIPANKVSSNRIINKRVAESNHGSNAQFEFGTVMMFPAGDKRHIIESSIYRAPRRGSAVQYGQPLKPPGTTGFGIQSPVANSNNRSPLVQTSTLKTGTGDSTLATSVLGPERLLVNTLDEFVIVLTNTSPQSATNIIIQLKAPDGITISKLDRSAWLDETNRTVSWKIAELPGGHRTSIRYQAVSLTPGRHPQRITVGMENVYQGEMKFETVVSIPQGNGTAAGFNLNQ